MISSTKQQRQLIGIACNQLGIDKTLKEEMLRERFGQGHTTEISRLEADEFLHELRRRGFRYRAKKKPITGRATRKPRATARTRQSGCVVTLASGEELEKIEAVARLIRWRVEDGYNRWLKKRMGIDRVRTAWDAYRTIEGLKKMYENAMQKEFGERWWLRVFDDPRIEVYKTEHCPAKFRAAMQVARQEAMRS